LPELAKTQRDFWQDTERISKPLVDELATEEFDLCIIYAMEYGNAVKLTIWDDRFTSEITGRVQNVDPIKNELRIEVESGEFEKVIFASIVGVKVVK
jgi:hypothetical protein